MSGLIPASPADSYSSDHSRFFSNSDDDAETASQRSISLSSGPSSPKPKRGFSLATPASPALSTPMSTSFPHHDDEMSPSEHSADEPMHSDEEMETHSTAGSGPSPSFKFDEEEEEGGHTRHSSMSSSASLFSGDEDSTKQQTRGRTHLQRLDTSYNPASQAFSPASAVSAVSDYGPVADHRAADAESLASANTGKSGVSAGSGGRKVRPESTLLETPDDPLVLGVALVDFNHVASVLMANAAIHSYWHRLALE